MANISPEIRTGIIKYFSYNLDSEATVTQLISNLKVRFNLTEENIRIVLTEAKLIAKHPFLNVTHRMPGPSGKVPRFSQWYKANQSSNSTE